MEHLWMAAYLFLSRLGWRGGGDSAGGWFMGWRRLGATLCPHSDLRFS